MDIQIKNTAELKDFVLNGNVGINDKIELTNQCLNIIILGSVPTTADLIDIINENSHNENKIIILGKGVKQNDNN
jgi:glycerol-3-phosphate dehydrogenase